MNEFKEWLGSFVTKAEGSSQGCLDCLFNYPKPEGEDHLTLLRFAESEGIDLKKTFEIRLTEKIRALGLDPAELAKRHQHHHRRLTFRDDRLVITNCITVDVICEDVDKMLKVVK
jgi:hypothetical protein